MAEKNIEIIHKEIDLIQNCINRTTQNSFLIKGWALTIVAVVLVQTDKITDPVYPCLVILIPLLAFWYLDAFFLQTERMYRKMYKWVLEARSKEDYTHLYEVNPNRFKEEVDSRCKIMWSVTLRVFYGIPFLIVVAVIIYQILSKSLCK